MVGLAQNPLGALPTATAERPDPAYHSTAASHQHAGVPKPKKGNWLAASQNKKDYVGVTALAREVCHLTK